jgi:hypothetical protein
VCDSVDGAVRQALSRHDGTPVRWPLDLVGQLGHDLPTASVKALFSRTALTVAHLDEIEARLGSEHHLADEPLTTCSMPSVQRRSPQPGRTPIASRASKANRHDGPLGFWLRRTQR